MNTYPANIRMISQVQTADSRCISKGRTLNWYPFSWTYLIPFNSICSLCVCACVPLIYIFRVCDTHLHVLPSCKYAHELVRVYIVVHPVMCCVCRGVRGSFHIHSIPSAVRRPRWDISMKLNCFGGNEIWNFGGLVLGCPDADFWK